MDVVNLSCVLYRNKELRIFHDIDNRWIESTSLVVLLGRQVLQQTTLFNKTPIITNTAH